jgi:hypothetical protein
VRPDVQLVDSGDANTAAAFDAARGVLVLVVANYDAPRCVTQHSMRPQ